MQTPSKAPKTSARVLPAAVQQDLSYDEAQRQLSKVNAGCQLYKEIEKLCYALLTVLGIGTVINSAGMFLMH